VAGSNNVIARTSGRIPAGAWRWLAVWKRAVVDPARQRVLPVWIGCSLVGALVFGPTAMRPSDLTGLALDDIGVGLTLAAIWLLMFVPVARMIVRPAAAAYLASLPGAPRAARWLAAGTLIWLQLPWLALWVVGAGLVGAAVVGGMTLIIVAIARWQPVRRRVRAPMWRTGGRALRAIYGRAVVRRAGDALVRGAGLAVLAGVAAGLIVRNNQLSGQPAGVLGASVVAVVLIPAQIAPALAMLAAHRETAWMAQSYGIAPRTRVAALAWVVVVVHVAASAVAAVAAMAISGLGTWLPALVVGTGLATGLLEVRTLVVQEASPSVGVRVVVRAVAAAAMIVVCLSVLDAVGVVVMVVAGAGAALAVVP
jgi:hypothetical protein